jgi:2-methylaconitate cis-trans-isomerase PrpF
MLAAVAFASISHHLVPFTALHRYRSSTSHDGDGPVSVPVRILAANTGAVLTARVSLDPQTTLVYEPQEGKGARIAGVPGEAAPIEVELPLEMEGGGTVTGNPRDVVEIDGHKVSPPISCLLSLPNAQPLSSPEQ